MKPWTTWTATCLILCSIGFMPLHTSAVDNVDGTSLTQVTEPSKAASPAPDSTDITDLARNASFGTTISKWQSTLAKEKGFEGWTGAKWNSYPLGPGTHGWVILLSDQGHEVGYMIVHATESGDFRLTEYGTGSSPLFSLSTLYRSLVQQELIPSTNLFEDFVRNKNIQLDRLYAGTLTSVWKITLDNVSYYLDAKSGELLPLTEDPKPHATSEIVKGTELSDSALTITRPSFDPYEMLPWIQGTPLPVTSLAELQVAFDQNEDLTYVINLYDNQVTMPLAILGFQQWAHGDTYLTLDHEGPRYVRLDETLGFGSVYP
ncbi:hypothetical protein [Paenibacillus roseipurpureus]|uniref:PepSY domain-containing protein n=1 Tax=Paenibacillus roseopurpureus TaxID=2918901 RepID=A0AA96LNN8_9BACL|nr:hypothetical protein [Paenibacillus sp. MBLB1832]WNR43063.1 hypothetical protein MJB10_18355 [Paenibacillus sp. MBLB1832]